MQDIFASATKRFMPAGTLALVILLTGCIDPKMMQPREKSAETTESAATDNPSQAPAEAAPAAPAFPSDNTKLVDKKQILAENPKLVEVENKINATDPVSAATQGYFALGSQVQLLNLKHAIDLYKAEHEKPPTFVEFDKMIRDAHVPLKGILRWQVYAYDEDTGEMCILEDRDYKKREYEKAGLKWEGS